jgi:hypothetical protein
MPKLVEIGADRLREVMSANRDASGSELAKLLDVGYSTLQKKIASDAELTAVYDELKHDRRGKGERASTRKAASHTPPPQRPCQREVTHERRVAA